MFSTEEKQLIKTNQMLSDESINLAQNLLCRQFAQYDGLFDTVIALQNGFDIVKHYRPFIQILHTSTQHWICIGNLQTNRISNKPRQYIR